MTDDAGSNDRADEYLFVYGEGRGALDTQEAALDNIRSRAGTLISATAIATSFLGGIALDSGPPDLPGVAAIVLFVVVIASGIAILWPRHWTFRPGVAELLRDWVDAAEPATLPEIHKGIAEYMQAWYTRNERQLDRLYNVFAAASGLLLVEVLLWLVEVGWFS